MNAVPILVTLAFCLVPIAAAQAEGGSSETVVAASEPARDARSLFLISPAGKNASAGSDPYGGYQAYALALSEDPSKSVDSSVSFDFDYGFVQSTPGCPAVTCVSTRAPGIAKAVYSEDSFPLAQGDRLLGQLHLAWDYAAALPSVCCEPDDAAAVYTELYVEHYRLIGEPIVLPKEGSDKVFPIEFTLDCDENCTGWDDGQISAEGAELVINIVPFYNQFSGVAGSHLHVKLDTAGGTSVELPEFIPPPPPAPTPMEAEPVVDSEPDSPFYIDENGDIAFVPSPTLPVVLLGIGLLAIRMRRVA